MVVEYKPIRQRQKGGGRIRIREEFLFTRIDLTRVYVTIIRRIDLSRMGRKETRRRYTRLFRSSSKRAPI